MADIKISELEPTTDLEGLYTIGTDKNNLSKKVALQFLKDAADYANTQGDYAAGQANNISQNIGMSKYGLFSEANNYGAFSVVRYNDKLWRFTQYHSAGAWLGTDVEQISVLDELAITDLGNILSLDVSKLMTLLEKELYYRYTGVIEISVDGEIYYGTMLHLSKDSEGNLVVRFICENTLYVAVNLGATAWQISKVSDLAEWENKLAQLSEEWQALQDEIQDAVLNVEVAPHIEVVTIEGGAAILQPDKLYDFGEVANLAIGFEAPLEGKAANYAFQFKSPAAAPTTITMPDSVVFPVESDSMFNVKAGRTYQVTILNGLAVATSWEV